MNKLSDLAISDSGFVFDPYSGATFTVNSSGLAILHLLREGVDRSSMLEQLNERFDIRGDDLHRDLDEFLGLMRRHELLDPDFGLE